VDTTAATGASRIAASANDVMATSPGVALATRGSTPVSQDTRTFDLSDPIVRDHRVRGASIVPGVALLDFALRKTGSSGCIRRFAWLKPVTLTDGPVCTRVERVSADRDAFQLVSGLGEASLIHARWHVDREVAAPIAEKLDVRALRAELAEIIDPDELYQRYARIGIAYGPSFRRVVEIHADEKHVLVRLEGAPQRITDALHVPTIDAALQGIILLAGIGEARQVTHVPFSVGKVCMAGPCTADMWSLIRRREGDGFDVQVADGSGIVCVTLEDLCTRPFHDPVSRPRRANSFDRFFYRPTWL
jgi:hypothetical protein